MKMSKKLKTSNAVLLALGIFILAFVITMIVIFCVKGAVPDTLIQYTLGAGGLECLVLAAIKISKVVVGEKVNVDNQFNQYEGAGFDENSMG